MSKIKQLSSYQSMIPRFKSVKTKLIFAFISFALIPFVLLCGLYTIVSKNALRSTSSDLNLEVVHQASQNINIHLDNTEDYITNLGANVLLKSGYIKDAFSKDKKAATSAILGINSLMSTAVSSQPEIGDSCFIADGLDQVVGSIPSLNTVDLKKLLADNNTSSKFLWIHPEQFANAKYVVVAKEFTDMNHKINYSIFIRYNLNSIISYIDSISLLENSRIYLADQNHTLLSSTDETVTELEDYISHKLTENMEDTLGSFNTHGNIITYGTLTNGWKLIVETPVSSLTKSLDSALFIVLIFLLLMIAVAASLGYFFANSFSQPIIHLRELMKKAEEGDLTVLAHSNRKDEFADLCLSFNRMIENIKQLINNTQVAVSETLNSTSILSESASQSVVTIQELSSAVSEIAQGTTTQALDAQKSTQDMNSLSLSMENATSKTDCLLSNTEGAKSMIENANSTMHSLISTMNSSLEMSNDICSSMEELHALNQNIAAIMMLVDNISEETNLLALNASIEAARVGEAGKGFAVVANEVRRLADESKSSTVNVRATLSTITKKMNETVDLAEKSKAIIQSQETVVEETHTLFNNIIEVLITMTTELKDINNSIHSMQSLKNVMVEQIDSIASVTEESAASTEEVSGLACEQEIVFNKLSTLADGLSQNMKNLNEMIQMFKVN